MSRHDAVRFCMRIARIGEQQFAVAILWRQSVLEAVQREASAKYEVSIHIEATTCLGNSMVLGLSDIVGVMALVASAVTSLPHQAVTGLLCWNRSAMAETFVRGGHEFTFPALLRFYIFERG